jgi:branched-subunit amino acid ABC-type transport system permease component
MGSEILQFAILGLGAGGVYALAGLGVVVVYRGAGVVNFAAGAMGMVGAFIFYDQRGAGTPALLALAAALLYAVLIGIAMHMLVMRPLRGAPPIARLIATLAVFTLIFAAADEHWGENARVVPSILPTDGVRLGSGVVVGADRLILLGIAVLLTAVLAFVYRRTWFGLATTAVVENRQVAGSLGVFTDGIALVNWILGAALGVVSAILIVNVSGSTSSGSRCSSSPPWRRHCWEASARSRSPWSED